jgi:hypothetical protein
MQPLRDHLYGQWAPDVDVRKDAEGFYVASACGVEGKGPDREQALDDFQGKWNVAVESGEVLPDM